MELRREIVKVKMKDTKIILTKFFHFPFPSLSLPHQPKKPNQNDAENHPPIKMNRNPTPEFGSKDDPSTHQKLLPSPFEKIQGFRNSSIGSREVSSDA
jgi:hypothetical protein